MSSVKAEISGITLANEVRLERAVHKGSFLLVEGDTDASLFRKFISVQDCAIVVCSGKENTFLATTILSRSGFCGALSIVDKDFADFLGSPVDEVPVFFTDHNDVEIMILSSTCLSYVLLEFGVDDKVDAVTQSTGMEVCDILFDAAAFLGALRLLSLREEWHLKFEGMNYKFLDANSYVLDEIRTVQHIVARSERRPSISELEVAEIARLEKMAANSHRDICCGHDCVRILGRALRRSLGNTNLFNSEEGAKQLSKVLRVAYGWEQFRETELFRSILEWELGSGYVVFRR